MNDEADGIELTVADGFARCLYADHDAKTNANEWIEFRIRVRGDGNRRSTEMQAILRVRAAFDKQIERIRRESPPG